MNRWRSTADDLQALLMRSSLHASQGHDDLAKADATGC